ncbi:hypothetical protein [Nocardioides litoris]|uniref:hypothetical protein n=1 Tax=Nocardioides litoris TaxID=1926648 RepID=UPI00111F194F|nr:hypothetical protein [Nocardioides litoris]
MLDRAYLHIGQPKTGTTYLQDVVWGNRDLLLRDGLVLPGRGHREHLWAALDVQERGGLARRHPEAPGSWERLCRELDEVEGGAALVTHEFFCGASAEQARSAVERLPAHEVHVVVTARDAAGLLAAGWQEMVKNGGYRNLRSVADDDSHSEFSWRTWDLGGVLERWGPTVPPDRVHVLPMPAPGSPPDDLWRRFADVLGATGDDYDVPERPANPSLGVVEAELLRRINMHLEGFDTPYDRGTWIRGYLAERRLRDLRPDSERVSLSPRLARECAERSARAVALVRERGFAVHGDLDQVLGPQQPAAGRTPGQVADDELLDVATRLLAVLLGDVRDLGREAGRRPDDVGADAGADEGADGGADDRAGGAEDARRPPGGEHDRGPDGHPDAGTTPAPDAETPTGIAAPGALARRLAARVRRRR